MRGKKGSVHEGGVRVPCFIRWLNQIPRGSKIERIAAHIDLLPTLASLADLELPKTLELDGIDLSELLKNQETKLSERLLFTHHFQRGGNVAPFPGSVRNQQYRATNRGDGWQLFDLSVDPGEKINLGKQLPDELLSLTRAYDQWFTQVTSTGFDPIATEIGHKLSPKVTLPAHEALLSPAYEISFSDPSGWAHDWITNWSDPEANGNLDNPSSSQWHLRA